MSADTSLSSSRWAGVVERIPGSLSALSGPSCGMIELPFDLAWSGRRLFNLDDSTQRYLYYMTILTAGITQEHYTKWLNERLLITEWRNLRLPRPLRQLWQERFSELSSD